MLFFLASAGSLSADEAPAYALADFGPFDYAQGSYKFAEFVQAPSTTLRFAQESCAFVEPRHREEPGCLGRMATWRSLMPLLAGIWIASCVFGFAMRRSSACGIFISSRNLGTGKRTW